MNKLKESDIEIKTDVKGAKKAQKELEDLQSAIQEYLNAVEGLRLSADEKELRQIDKKYEALYLKLEAAKEAELKLLQQNFDKGLISADYYHKRRNEITRRYNKESNDIQRKHGEDVQTKMDEQEEKRIKTLNAKKQKYIDTDIAKLNKSFQTETLMRKADFDKQMA